MQAISIRETSSREDSRTALAVSIGSRWRSCDLSLRGVSRVADAVIAVRCRGLGVIRRGWTRCKEGWGVVIRASRVSIAERLVIDGEEWGAWRGPEAQGRGERGVERARAVIGGVRGVAAAAPDVHNEGRKVGPRRSERRPQGPEVSAGERVVAA